MESSTIDKYITRFSHELQGLLIYLDNLVPIERTQQILEKFDKLSMIKIIKRYHSIMTPNKELISKKDVELFSTPCYIVPEINLSFYYENLPDTKRKVIWDALMKLLICSNIVIDNSNETKNKIEVPKRDEKKDVDLMAGVGNNDQTFSTDTIIADGEKNKLDGNPMFNLIKDKLNVDEITDQLKHTDKNTISQMTNDVKNIIAPNINDPAVSGLVNDMISDIGDELKNTDITNGDLFGNLINIAEKMSTKVAANPNMKNCTPEKLLASTKAIMKSMGMPEGFNPMDMLGNDPSALNSILGSLGGNSEQTKKAMNAINDMMKKK